MRKLTTLLIILITLFSCKENESTEKNKTSLIFEKLDASASGINFSNDIIENDTLNYFEYPYLYLGAGISVGDINNDGLPDIYITGNLVSNKLYLNKGNLQFEDITDNAGVSANKKWCSGSTMVDINSDGYLDIYVSVSSKFGNGANLLFINNKDNTFTESAQSYGIADKSTSIQSTFFDYNNDGLLDLFVANYPDVMVSMGNTYYHKKMLNNNFNDSGHLYKNNGDNTFTDVTTVAGVQNFGLTLGLVASDFNNDGFKDLYLSNDFNVPDYLYQNNGDGTFTDISKKAMKQTSMFGMGIDASDYTNDGFIDFLQVDMTASDYKRSKTNMASMSPETFYDAVALGFNHQYMQNSLQINNGVNLEKIPVFSNTARLAGMATTDWSWGPVFADFDNDGWKDVFITNGVKRDVNNNDINEKYNTQALFGIKKKKDYRLLPSTPISNYAYKNNGDYTFTKVAKKWNLDDKGFSNGASYADLDNDGDLDLVINNLDGVASVYINEAQKENTNFMKIKLKGKETNKFGIGAKVSIEVKGLKQIQELTLTRGYQSSVEPILHFGLGNTNEIDEIVVIWPDGKKSILNEIISNQLIEIDYKNAGVSTTEPNSKKNHFLDITEESNINFKHTEDIYNDFYYEPLLPHKNSEMGPGLTVGDVNGDGLEDFFIGGAKNSSAQLYLQNSSGKFEVLDGPWQDDVNSENTGALLFDADNDSDLDLYVINGGNNKNDPKSYHQDKLYINTTNGFIETENSLPKIYSSGLKVISGDYDKDGDLDLFIGGRLVPGEYPLPAESYILRNDGGKNLKLKYTNVTENILPELKEAGLVTSALWEDFNLDGNLDLIIAGEWMPIRFFKNTGEKFKEVTNDLGFDAYKGWWYSLEKVDLDADGDMDYLAGNLGLNYKYKASKKEPFEIYYNDFDGNGTNDIVLSYEKKGTKLPLRGRECSSQQVPAIKKRFETFESFANADLNDIYGAGMLEKSLHYATTTFSHYWIENKGDGTYEMNVLPNESQFSSINEFEIFDYNNDKYPDVLIGGNLYNSEVETPRNDASIGAIITGGINEDLRIVNSKESSLFLEGEIKEIKPIKLGNKGEIGFLVAANNQSLRLIVLKKEL